MRRLASRWAYTYIYIYIYIYIAVDISDHVDCSQLANFLDMQIMNVSLIAVMACLTALWLLITVAKRSEHPVESLHQRPYQEKRSSTQELHSEVAMRKQTDGSERSVHRLRRASSGEVVLIGKSIRTRI